jgi:hypothetical protein
MFRSTLRKFDAVYGYRPDLIVTGFYTYKFRPLHTQIQLSFLVRGFSPSEGFGLPGSQRIRLQSPAGRCSTARDGVHSFNLRPEDAREPV